MNIKNLFFFFCFFSLPYIINAQGKIHGQVYNALNNEPLSFVSVGIPGTNKATLTDEKGYYEIKDLSPGYYTISASYLGFESKTFSEIEVNNTKHSEVNFPLEEKISALKELEVKASPFVKKEESPISLRTISVAEIARNPGGNRDISKVIQSFPGVAPTVAYRNDIIIRGGAPNENRFYLDGIEIPNINHFATQGSSGGPVGMVNVDFIREVEFYSSAFAASRNNALSSIMEFKYIDGRNDRIGGKASLGASDLGLTLEGPVNKNATFLASYRRSYLQFLFKAIGLPFLPTYNDFQAKYKWKIDNNNEITFIGLGAVDNSSLNLSLQETGTKSQKYILGYLPEYYQWNYANGIKYVNFNNNGFTTLVLSRNMLNNESKKYLNNVETPANILNNYKSQEIENKFRVERTTRKNDIKFTYGANVEYAKYKNSTFQKITISNLVDTIDFSSGLNIWKYGLFSQLSAAFIQGKLSLSAGIRTDASDFSKSTRNLFKQLSPRLSLSYAVNQKIKLNGNVGIYYQLPAYTILGYRNKNFELVNQINNVSYIRTKHLVAGLEYLSQNNLKVTLEGFYKYYNQYPFILKDSISLANLGGGFGVIGNTEVVSTSKGRSYGVELLAQQKLFKGLYGIFTYTFVRSQFQDKKNQWVVSSWDNIHIFNITAGKTFKKNWEVGMKWRFGLGSPYTPYNFELSRIIQVWDINKTGVPNYDLLNTERLPASHQLDLRIDKKVFLKKITLDFYVDLQNAYNFKSTQPPVLDVVKDANNNIVVDEIDPTKYKAELIQSKSGQLIPSIGISVEF